MKAMVFEGLKEGRGLVARETAVPEPGAGEILIRVRACAVCHTDLHIVDGELMPPKLPVVPGHQAVGTVEKLGAGVTGRRVGQRVGVPWLHSACGGCDQCRRGNENLCDGATFTGYHVDGGFAEYLVARADYAPLMPDRFDPVESAPLLCAGIIGYRTLHQSRLERGERLGLFGFGAAAHLALQVATYWGCEVFVFTRSEDHRRLARDLGAAWCGGPDEAAPCLLDRAAVFAPSGDVVVHALRRIRKGGTVAVNAIHMDRIPSFDYELLYGERSIVSVTNSTRADAGEFLTIAAKIPFRVAVERYALADANTALGRLRRREISGAAVIEIPDSSGYSLSGGVEL